MFLSQYAWFYFNCFGGLNYCFYCCCCSCKINNSLYMTHYISRCSLLLTTLFSNKMLILQFQCVFVDLMFAKTTTCARNINKVSISAESGKNLHITWRKVTFNRSNVSFCPSGNVNNHFFNAVVVLTLQFELIKQITLMSFSPSKYDCGKFMMRGRLLR